jgi:hypothetical protein
MCGLWQPEGFADVLGIGDWEDRVADSEALGRRITDGLFVPLNVGGDGGWQVDLRSDGLSSRKERHLLVSSDPYLLVSEGVVELGGLEQVGRYSGGAVRIPLRPGRYRVCVNLIEWDAEPGSTRADGSPTSEALPDFVVIAEPESHRTAGYRVHLETFDRPA